MERPEPWKVDDEGLPLPPPAKEKASRWLLRIMERSEMVLFIAIALALLAIAIAVFVRGMHDLSWPRPRRISRSRSPGRSTVCCSS